MSVTAEDRSNSKRKLSPLNQNQPTQTVETNNEVYMISTFHNKPDQIQSASPESSSTKVISNSKPLTLKHILQLETKVVKPPIKINQVEYVPQKMKSSLEVKLEEDLNKLKAFTLARKSNQFGDREKRPFHQRVGSMVHVSKVYSPARSQAGLKQ